VELGLDGGVVLVTGGSSGIGAAVAEALIREGARVSITARRQAPLDAVAAALGMHGGNAIAVAGDMGSTSDVERVVAATVARFGGLDVVVNNAGSSVFAPLEEVSDERWLADLNTKLIGYVRCTRTAIPHLERSQRACIVNIGGNAGRQPLQYHLPGGAANAGILNFTQAMGQYLGPKGIRVVGIAPGLVETPRLEKQIPAQAAHWNMSVPEARERMVADIPIRRISTADDIADLVCFLASPRAGQITGTTVTIDGGYTRGI
jgi:NAD(P)-dependent dehydrogenase (short-subunit alcohol dehydrogenase family)